MIFVPAVAARAENPPRTRARDAFWRIAAGFETSPDRAPKKAGDASAGARDPPGIAAHLADAAQRAEVFATLNTMLADMNAVVGLYTIFAKTGV